MMKQWNNKSMAKVMEYDDRKRTVSEKILEKSETFYASNLKTGKILKTDNIPIEKLKKNALCILLKYISPLINSIPVIKLRAYSLRLFNFLMQFKAFNFSIGVISKAFMLAIKYYKPYTIILAVCIASIFILYLFSDISPFFIFICIIPFILINTFCLGILYLDIDFSEKAKTQSFIVMYKSVKNHFLSLTFLQLFTLAVLSIIVVGYFAVCLSLINVFIFFHQDWNNSYLYLDIIVCLLLLCLCAIDIVFMLNNSSFLLILLDGKKPQEAISISWKNLKSYFLEYFFFYFLAFLCFLPLIIRNIFALNFDGAILGIVLFVQICIFFSYVLLLTLIKSSKNPVRDIMTTDKSKNSIYILILISGFICFFIIGAAYTELYPNIVQLLSQSSNQNNTAGVFTNYTNTKYSYSVLYPGSWIRHEFSQNYITFENNTQSAPDGAWITISVQPVGHTVFNLMYSAIPGKVTNGATKLSNFTQQGYKGVEYNSIVYENPYNQYQTHYLINKNNLVYDIDFMVRSLNTEESYSGIFDNTIHSFNFTQ